MGSVWFAFAAITVVSEVTPVPAMPAWLHYGVYTPAKLFLFFIVGYLVPLAFARFNVLNRGIAFAFVSAAAIEILQGIIGNGHSFHSYELLLKWIVIALGFMFGLDARCEGTLDLGPLHLTLIQDRKQNLDT
jgi:hypothetical protein